MRLIYLIIPILTLFFIVCENVNLGDIYSLHNHGEYPKWFSDDSKILFVYQGYYDEKGGALCYVDSYGNNFSVIDMNGYYFEQIGTFCLIENDNFIVFSGEEISPNKSILYKIPSTGGTPVKLFEDKEFRYNVCPTWSPDGWVYFLRDDDGQNSIWKIKPDGTELSKIDINFDSHIYSITCSRDGKYLVMDYLNTKNKTEMMVLRLSDYKMWSVADDASFKDSNIEMYPCFSPDGRWICFTHNESLWIVPYDDSDDPIRITERDEIGMGPIQSDWSYDGQWMVFVWYGFIYKLKVPDEFLPR
ncbi:MAG: TolB family protein [bacterium]